MKKFTAILTAAFMVLSLTACTGGNDSGSSSDASGASGASNSSDASQSENSSDTSSDMDSSQSETDSSSTDSGSDSSSDSGSDSSQPGEGAEITDAATLLNTVFGLFGEEEQFAAMGGDYENPVDGQAGAFDISDPESFDNMAGFPAAEIGKIDSAATLVHMMNANTFTGTAVHLAEGTDAAALTETIKTNILSRQWMCGFPERLVVASVEDYLVFAFGYADLTTALTTHLSEAFPGASILCDEPIE